LALQLAHSGLNILGLDVDSSKVEAIDTVRFYIKHVNAEDTQLQLTNKYLEASTGFTRGQAVEAVLIYVLTSLNKNQEPDISYMLNIAKAIATHKKKTH